MKDRHETEKSQKLNLRLIAITLVRGDEGLAAPRKIGFYYSQNLNVSVLLNIIFYFPAYSDNIASISFSLGEYSFFMPTMLLYQDLTNMIPLYYYLCLDFRDGWAYDPYKSRCLL
jgi:hypothetical protein